jgi:hypothetical protein
MLASTRGSLGWHRARWGGEVLTEEREGHDGAAMVTTAMLMSSDG